MLRITGIALLTATVVAILGCGGGSPSPAPASPPPAPSISISPTSAVAGGPDLTLTVLGSNFLGETHNFSQAVWSANSSNTLLATTFVSSTQLTAVIPSALLTNAITGQVFVQTGDPMGDIPLRKSDSVSFSVTIPSPGVPSISSISPTSAVVGSPDLTLTVTGSNFVNANRYHNVVAWSVNGNDTSLATTFVSSTQLTAVIPASLLLNPTAAKVSVQTWYFDNDIPTSVSNSVSFSVTSSGAFVSNSSATRRPEDMRQLAANPVLEWNQTAITAALAADQTTAPGSATQGGSGIYLAYVHLAIFNAVNTIDHRYHSYGTELVEQKGASKKAAIASAGYHTLVSLLPDQAATLATEYSNALGAIPDSTAKNRGIHADKQPLLPSSRCAPMTAEERT
ncbi:MAG: hypothetical protein DMG96_36565 [Acidobacteria bacterium]|nr:MAG: hypothetical protein DMG96_36565 [Acidobacteriota bacterium]